MHRDTPQGNILLVSQRLTRDPAQVMAVTAVSTLTCKRYNANILPRPHMRRSAVAQVATAMRWNLIIRRGKCVSDSSAGRSLSPSLLCFRAQRPAKPTFRNPGVRTAQETNRARQFALTVLITNAWKIRRAAAAWLTRGSNRSRRFQVRLPSCYRSRCTTHTIKSAPLKFSLMHSLPSLPPLSL
jgi:hypothetical protein